MKTERRLSRMWRRLRLSPLENRITPAIGFTGPYSPTQLMYLHSTGADAWLGRTQLPAAPAGRESYLQLTQSYDFGLNAASIGSFLGAAPHEVNWQAPPSNFKVDLPGPDGVFHEFRVWQVDMMASALAAAYPDIVTFRGQGIDNPADALALDETPNGLHAQVLSPTGAWYIDPYYHLDTSTYVSFYGKDSVAPQSFECDVDDLASARGTVSPPSGGGHGGVVAMPLTSNGGTLRIYRTAIAATGEYTQFYGGTKGAALAGIVTTLNRVSGIYETEVSVRMQLVANDDRIIYTDPATDPYTNTDGGQMLGQNQANVDLVIGKANYDLGHVVSTGGGGVATLACVGVDFKKARGVTGQARPIGDSYDVDYVSHEMGHQFGANHNWNSPNFPITQWQMGSAFEIGSGSTIMNYAGLGGTDDYQKHSDPNFSSKSLDEIAATITAGPGVGFTQAATNNRPPTANAGANYTIPASTPFQLTASGTDPDGDAVTFSWEERDNSAAPQALSGMDAGTGPLFRPFPPTSNKTRVFPQLGTILKGQLASTDKSEVLPTTNRNPMNFRVVVRDNKAGGGAFNSADTQITVNNGAGPFKVTAANGGEVWAGGSKQTITWNVAKTDMAPIMTANVKITLSTDGGVTFPTVLAANVPNNAAAMVNIPNTPSLTARVKVEAIGNIFFDISDANFTITNGAAMQVVSTNAAVGSVVAGPMNTLAVTFNSPINKVDATKITLSSGMVTGTATAGNVLTLNLAGVPADGLLAVTLAAGTATDAGNVANLPFVGNYTIDAAPTTGGAATDVPFTSTPFVFVPQYGAQSYTATATGAISPAGDQDKYSVMLDPNQQLTVQVNTTAGTLQPDIVFYDTAGKKMAQVGATVPGQAALMQSQPVTIAGKYTFVIQANNGAATGNYKVQAWINAAREAEGNGGLPNDNLATAQSLNQAFVNYAGAGKRAAVIGTTDGSNTLPAEFENNDTLAQANDASRNFSAGFTGNFLMGLNGSLVGAGDSDYFNIGTLDAGEFLSVAQMGSASMAGTQPDPLVELYRDNGNNPVLITSNDDGGPGLDSLIYRANIPVTDTYYVRATRFNGSGDGTYQLALNLSGNVGAEPMTGGNLQTEVEPNDSTVTADNASMSWRKVNYSSTTTGSITAGDVDYFSYSFTAGDRILVRTTPFNLDTRLTLYDMAGNVIALEDGTSDGPGDESYLFAYVIPTTGKYYVAVSANNAPGNYAVTVELSTLQPPPTSGDDYYSFTAGNGQRVSVSLKQLNGGAANVDLLDGTGAVLASGAGGPTNFEKSIQFNTALLAGTYFVRVREAAVHDYQMVVGVDLTFDREVNDTFATSQTMLPSGGAMGAIDAAADADNYTQTLAVGDKIYLETVTPADGPNEFTNALDPILDLFDGANTKVATDDNSAADGRNAKINYTVPAGKAGDYRIRVRSFNNTQGEYVLKRAVTQTTFAPSIDAMSPMTYYTDTKGMLQLVQTYQPGQTVYVDEGDTIQFNVTASDPDTVAANLTFSLVGAPAAAAITAGGKFTWQTDDGPAESQTITVKVADDSVPANTTTATFNVVVVNLAPTASLFATVPPVAPNTNATFQLKNAGDFSNADTKAGFLYSFDFNNDGIFEITKQAGNSAMTKFAAVGLYNIRVRIEDKDGGFNDYVYSDYQVSNGALNNPPTITTIGDKSVNEGSKLQFNAVGADPDAGQMITYSLDPGAPAGAAIDAKTGQFTWTPTDGPTQSQFITVRVTDNGAPALSATSRFFVTVNNVAPTAMSFTAAPSPVGVNQQVTAMFNMPTDPSPDDLMAGLRYSYDWNNDGVFEISKTMSSTFFTMYAAAGVYTIKGRVEDKDGDFTDYLTMVTVVAPPQVNAIQRADANPNPGPTVHWTVTFSSPVSGLTPLNFNLVPGGAVTGYISSVTPIGPASVYTVSADSVGGNGTLELDMSNSNAVSDAYMQPVVNLPFFGEAYNITQPTASVTSITLNSAALTNAFSVSWHVTFNQPVSNVNPMDFSLSGPGASGAFVNNVIGSGSFWDVFANTGADGQLFLNMTSSIGTTPTVGNLPFNGPAYTIDRTPPLTTSILRNDPNPTSGPTVHWAVNFNEAVMGLNSTDFMLSGTGSTSATITNVSGSGTAWTVTAKTGAVGNLELDLTNSAGASDQAGNPIGMLPFAGQAYTVTSGGGSLPTVTNIQINDGSAQRSRVTNLTVTFSQPVTFPSGINAAFQLLRTTGVPTGPVGVFPTPSGNSVILTFFGSGSITLDPGSCLPDGRYQLTIFADKVMGAGGFLDGNGNGIYEGNPTDNKVTLFHRLYGDIDGNATVNSADFLAFRGAFGGTSFGFDFNNNNTVDAADFLAFRSRFGSSV